MQPSDMTRPFDIAISLGENCQTRRHLAEALRRRHGRDAGGGSFFFDWLWRDQGFLGVTRALQAHLGLAPDDFGVKRTSGGLEAYHRSYGFFFTHDFQLGTDLDAAPARLHEQLPGVLAKYRYLADKTLGILRGGRRVAFLVCGAVTDAEAAAFARTVEDSFGIDDYTVLHLPFANKGQAGASHPRFIVRPITYAHWPGDARAWAAALEELDVLPADTVAPAS